MSEDLTAVANFLYEAGTLKHTARTGWWMAGVRSPETVAEHSWRTSPIASVIAGLEGADPARAALLAVRHDSQESRTGEVNHLGKKYAEGEADPREITGSTTASSPGVARPSRTRYWRPAPSTGSAPPSASADAARQGRPVLTVAPRFAG